MHGACLHRGEPLASIKEEATAKVGLLSQMSGIAA